MKKINLKCIILFITTGFLMNVNAQKPGNYTITGKINGVKKVYLYRDGYGSGIIVDSAVANNTGAFFLKGSTSYIAASDLLVVGDGLYDVISLFLEEGDIKLNKYGTSYSATGTYDNDLNIKFITEKELFDASNTITSYYDGANRVNEKISDLGKDEKPDEKLIQKLQDSAAYFEMPISKYNILRSQKTKDFINKHPQTYVAARLLFRFAGSDTSFTLNSYNNLGSKIQSSYLGQKLYKEMHAYVPLEIGIEAPNFTTTDIQGQKISLVDFKGKYVLLDFWATWCGPCRAANPHLIELYNQYRDKGLEIIGIADDNNNVDGWEKTVKMDKIGIWKQILCKTTAEDPININTLYKIHTLPTQYLIDKDGKIIANVDVSNIDDVLKVSLK
ncbi:MAG: hypothetical protein DI598_00685 [Pseudopedobacter saltans]|uniref:Thioredoxin domain-containing protein n=1 Tax=Pseudopedobacter saltans TaxID=151895 RepID=A0A2W5F8S0_9SPHI|nr:MAG: hypothetical protein DI598_00685 [Pseudopedobacter saltans]